MTCSPDGARCGLHRAKRQPPNHPPLGTWYSAPPWTAAPRSTYTTSTCRRTHLPALPEGVDQHQQNPKKNHADLIRRGHPARHGMNGRDYARLRRAVRIAEERYPDEPAEVDDDQAADSTEEQVVPDNLAGGMDPFDFGTPPGPHQASWYWRIGANRPRSRG